MAVMPSLEVTIGQTATLNISTAFNFMNCQGLPATVTFNYETSSSSSSVKNNFITYASATKILTVNASASNTWVRPGSRSVSLYACTTASSLCQHISFLIIIHPVGQVNATTDVRTKTTECKPATEWPKVIGDTTGNASISTMEINSANGYMLISGWTDSANMKPTAYKNSGVANAFIVLTNNL